MVIIRYAVLVFVFAVVSCKRKEKETETPNPAGKGGNATLKIISKHHGKAIDSSTVYIKYNTSDAANIYDDSVNAIHDIDGKPVATFTGLKTGNYYLFARGWDTTISNTVIGGIPYTVEEQVSYDITVSVTEGD